MNITMIRVIALWNQGRTLAAISASLSLPANTAASWVQRARVRLGEEFVPHRPAKGTPKRRPPSPLDYLHAVGDRIIVSANDGKSRACLHQNARTRGWKIKLQTIPTGWVVTAVGKVPQKVTPSR
jgi:hypothetical protein